MIEPRYRELMSLPHHRIQPDRSRQDGGYLTDDEPSPWVAARDAAWAAAQDAAQAAVRAAAQDAAWVAAWVAAQDAAWVAAWVAAQDAAWLADQDFTTPTPAAVTRTRPFDIEHEPLPAHTARHRNRHRNLWAFLRRRPH